MNHYSAMLGGGNDGAKDARIYCEGNVDGRQISHHNQGVVGGLVAEPGAPMAGWSYRGEQDDAIQSFASYAKKHGCRLWGSRVPEIA